MNFSRDSVARLKAIPGATNAAFCIPLPFSGDDSTSSFRIQGRTLSASDPGPHSRARVISPEYFATMGVPIKRGRAFTDADRAGAEPVVIIDENLASQYWPKEDPLDQYLSGFGNAPPIRIVGIVANIRQTDIAADSNKGIRYFPVYQRAFPMAGFVVRSGGSTMGVGAAMRQAIQSVEPTQPVYNLEPMDVSIRNRLAPRRVAMNLLGLFAGTALFMAALGLYGVISYSVTQRTQEIGIRMALGAQPGQVLGLVIGQGAVLAGMGVAIGLGVAFWLAGFIKSQLFGVSPFDPVTFGAMAVVIGGVAMLASFLPARRAARVDPLVALRYE
jgi:putative ABC transport system permease protein